MEASVFRGLPEHVSIKENAYQDYLIFFKFQTKLYFCHSLGISVLVKFMTRDFDPIYDRGNKTVMAQRFKNLWGR